MVRLTFPKVKAEAWEKAAGLIQLSIRCPTSPEVAGETPVVLGLWLALYRYWLLLVVFYEICSGYPEEITLTTFRDQPPTARSAARFTLPRNGFPRPNGNS